MQVTQERQKGRWRAYLIVSLGVLLTILPVVAVVYFREEIQQAEGYGYTGVFLVGILSGVSIIPAPTQLLVFTFGSVLNPLYVGLVAGFGGAVGGITVYLTGASMETVWSRLRTRGQDLRRWLFPGSVTTKPIQPKFWTICQVLYRRLVNWAGAKGVYWALFISSAMIISPFYFAGLTAGSLRIGLLKFFLITWAGKTVRYLAIAFAGNLGLHAILKWIWS